MRIGRDRPLAPGADDDVTEVPALPAAFVSRPVDRAADDRERERAAQSEGATRQLERHPKTYQNSAVAG